MAHHRFHELPRLLAPGDPLVVNDSRTLPASLLGRTAAGEPLEVRLAARDGEGGAGPGEAGTRPSQGGGRHGTGEAEAGTGERWAALVLGVPADGTDPALVATDAWPLVPPVAAGERIVFAGGLARPCSAGTRRRRRSSGWPSTWPGSGWPRPCTAGRPVRYAYAEGLPLHHYQTLFAAGPGSAEMASAGRPFTVQTL